MSLIELYRCLFTLASLPCIRNSTITPPLMKPSLPTIGLALMLLAMCSLWHDLHAQALKLETILAISGPDKPKQAWEVNAALLEELGKLGQIEPLEAKLLGNTFLSAALRKRPEDKEHCCYEKVADGVWSCCDGTFVYTKAPNVSALFSVAGKGTQLRESEKQLPERFQALVEMIKRPDAFAPLKIDDPSLKLIPWEKMMAPLKS